MRVIEMKEGETIEPIIEGEIRRIDALRERNKVEGIKQYEIENILAGFRLFLQDLSACELGVYNPYEMHPQMRIYLYSYEYR